MLVPGRRDQHELAHVPGPAGLPSQRAELGDQVPEVLLVRRLLPRVTGRADTRGAGQAVDLEPGVLAERPVDRIGPASCKQRLPPRVLVERRALFLTDARDVERLNLPIGQERPQLTQLPGVAGGESDAQGLRGLQAAKTSRWRSTMRSMPPAASSTSSASCSFENGVRSAVACTSTSRPSPVITTFMSTSADASSS